MTAPEGLPTIDVDTAATATDCVLLDVREYDEWMSGRIPEAIHMPIGDVTKRVGELDRSTRIICVCRSGNRSARVTSWLLTQGLDAVNMSGGMQAWASHGHRLINHAGNPGVVI